MPAPPSKEEQESRTKALYALKRQLDHLRTLRGTGTEMISVYIPGGQPIHETAGKLREEAGQASNIKSKSTRKNVTDALERILQHLKTYGHVAPESGVAIFCGNISDNPARVDIEVFTVYPPEPLSISLYRCDSRFFLEPLERMNEVKETYGLVVMDGRECTLATLRGTSISILRRLNSTAHAKIRKGGQSARRYERLIEESIELYYKRIGEAMDQYFVTGIKGVLVGGPGPAKEDFVKMSPFNYQIKVLGVQDTGYTDEQGLRELMAKSSGLIAAQEAVKEKLLVDRFIKEVASGGLAIYGEPGVRTALESRQASQLLVSSGLKWKRYHLKVSARANAPAGAEASGGSAERFVNQRAEQEPPKKTAEGQDVSVLSATDLVDDLIELADANGIKVEIVSTDTPEGAQFLQSFYGVGAFIRYKL